MSMTSTATAREALMAEAIGDVAKLIREVDALVPRLDQASQVLEQASSGLRDDLAGFERRIGAITENAKTQTVKHMAVRADQMARASTEVQSRAMADAARVAFGAELGATMQRLQVTLQPIIEQRKRYWERWLTHIAAAGLASAGTWILAGYLGAR